MATILLGFPLQYTLRISYFLSHIALQRKEKVSNFIFRYFKIFYHYKIVLSLFATGNKQYFIIMKI